MVTEVARLYAEVARFIHLRSALVVTEVARFNAEEARIIVGEAKRAS